MELENEIINQVAIHIEGDKLGFVSKSAIDKFKQFIKTNSSYKLDELSNKYIKPEYELDQINKTNNEIKFKVSLKQIIPIEPIANKIKTELKQKLKNNVIKETKYTIGQEKSSDMIKNIMIKLQQKYLSYRIIDVTNILTPNTYVEYQKANYFTNIIMVAEKTNSNSSVFAPRSNTEKSNIIIMYHGAYRTFNNDMFDMITDSLSQMIS